MLVAIGASIPAYFIINWPELHNEDPNQWPTSNYEAFHLAIIVVAATLTIIVGTVSLYLQLHLQLRKEAELGEEVEEDAK
jgi:hypothetical protein